MKQLSKVFFLFISFAHLCLNVYSYDFELDGIFYVYVPSEQSVYVTHKDYEGKASYSGNVVIPSVITYNGNSISVTAIGNNAFSGCEDLESIRLPNSIISIGDYAFNGCDKMTSIVIPNSVNSIGFGAFNGCKNITSVTMSEKLEAIEGRLFSGCKSLSNIIIPDKVKYIKDYAFEDCTSLKYVCIPENVREIGSRVFNDCTNLESVVIKESENGIRCDNESFRFVYPKYVFIGRTNMKSVTTYSYYFPILSTQIKVLSIGRYVKCLKYEADFIETIYSFSEKPDQIDVEFSNASYLNSRLYVPRGSREKYLKAEGWKNFLNIIETDAADMWRGDNDFFTSGIGQENMPSLIQIENGEIHISGIKDGTLVEIYSLNGTQVGTAIVSNGKAIFYTHLPSASIAIVRVRNKSVKVVVR